MIKQTASRILLILTFSLIVSSQTIRKYERFQAEFDDKAILIGLSQSYSASDSGLFGCTAPLYKKGVIANIRYSDSYKNDGKHVSGFSIHYFDGKTDSFEEEVSCCFGAWEFPAEQRQVFESIFSRNREVTVGIQFCGSANYKTLYSIRDNRIVQSSKPTRPKPTPQSDNRILEGVVVGRQNQPKWMGIIVESKGIKYSFPTSGDLRGHEPKIIGGDITENGTRVKVSYRNLGKPDIYGNYLAEATIIVKLASALPTLLPPVSVLGYVDVIEVTGSGCQIHFISGDKTYMGTISFAQLSNLVGHPIRNYQDAVAFFEGKQVNVTLSGITASNNGIYSGSFTGISKLTVVVPTGTTQTKPQWNETTTSKETVIDLSSDILFDFNKSTISPIAIPTLIKLARLLRQSKGNAVQLNGFTDSIGTDEYNIGLSQRRSEAVKQWLVTKGGIDARRLTTNGFGKAQPVAQNTNPDGSDNPTGRQKNRRVEIRIPRN